MSEGFRYFHSLYDPIPEVRGKWFHGIAVTILVEKYDRFQVVKICAPVEDSGVCSGSFRITNFLGLEPDSGSTGKTA